MNPERRSIVRDPYIREHLALVAERVADLHTHEAGHPSRWWCSTESSALDAMETGLYEADLQEYTDFVMDADLSEAADRDRERSVGL